MIDIILKGKISISSENRDKFLRAFDDLLVQNNATYIGTVKSYEFDEVEIVEDEETDN